MDCKNKVQKEYEALIKIGIPDNMAYLIANHKYGANKEEVEIIINDIKEQQEEISQFVKEFKPLEVNIEIPKIENLSLSNAQDKN